MSSLSIILPNPKTGAPEAFKVDMEKMSPSDIPQHMAGPFKYTFSLAGDDGKPRDFDTQICLNRENIIMACRVLPCITKVKKQISLENGPGLKAVEMNDQGRTEILELHAKDMGLDWIWISIGTEIGGGGIKADGSITQLKFYNFYNHGSVCMGGMDLRTTDPLSNLNNFIGGYVTPHKTYTGNHQFRIKEKRFVPSRTPTADPMDFPVELGVFTKPLANLMPC